MRSFASAALLVQIAIIYPIAAILKRRFEVWQDLTFVEEAMGVDGVATDLGRMLLELPAILPALSWASLQLETFGALLLFSPWLTRPLRIAGALAFMSFHAFGIGTTFAIGLFPWVMVIAWLVFLPSGPLLPLVRPEGAAATRVDTSEPRWQAALLAVLLVGVLVHNAGRLDWLPRTVARPVTDALEVVRLDQRWGLWTTVMYNRHYVFAARTRSGRLLDLHRDGAVLDWHAARRQTWNTRYWKLLLHLSKKRARTLRGPFAHAVAGRWDRAHPDDPVTRIELWMLREVEDERFRALQLWSEDGEARLLPPGRLLTRPRDV